MNRELPAISLWPATRAVVLLLCAVIAVGSVSAQRARGRLAAPAPAAEQPRSAEYDVYRGPVGKPGGTLTMAHEGNPRTFNPVIANETSSTDITNVFLNAALFDYDNETQRETLGLAREYRVSENGLTWELSLRRGLKFSDGSTFDADDVVFTWNVVTDPKVDNSIKDLFRETAGTFPRIEKVDGHTLRFALTEPNPTFDSALGSLCVLPSDRLSAAWRNGTFGWTYGLDAKPEEIAGMGPYRIKEYVEDEHIVLERNPHYWKVDSEGRRLPYIDRIVLTMVPNFVATLLSFSDGDADLLKQVRAADVETLKRLKVEKGFNVYDLGFSFNTNYLTFNLNPGKDGSGRPLVTPHRLAWFRNTKFRQAVSTAIDRQGLVQSVMFGLGTPIWSFVTPANKIWYNDAAHVKYPYDPGKAKALFAEIGMMDRNGDGVMEDANGNRVSFVLTTNVENEARKNTANFIKDNLTRVGIEVEFRPIPFNKLITKMRDSYEWESLILGWQTGVPPDPSQMKNVILSSGESHTWFPEQRAPATEAERRMNDLLYRNVRTLDLAERQRLFNELITIWTTECFEISLIASKFFTAASNRVKNLRPTALPPYTLWNVEELWLAYPPGPTQVAAASR